MFDNASAAVASSPINGPIFPFDARLALAILLMALNIVSAVMNSFCSTIFHRALLLQEQPMQPLAQLSFTVLSAQGLLPQMANAAFMLMNGGVEMYQNLCKFCYITFACTTVTIYWTYLFVFLTRICHTRGSSFFFRYKTPLAFGGCASAILAGGVVWGLGWGGILGRFYFDNKFLTCSRKSSVFETPTVAVQIGLTVLPILATWVVHVLSAVAPGPYPLPQTQIRVFASFNASFVLSLLLHAPSFLLMLAGDAYWISDAVYPVSTFLVSLTCFSNVAGLMIGYPSFRTVCNMLLHRVAWADIQIELQPRARRRYVARPAANQGEEQHFVEEAV